MCWQLNNIRIYQYLCGAKTAIVLTLLMCHIEHAQLKHFDVVFNLWPVSFSDISSKKEVISSNRLCVATKKDYVKMIIRRKGGDKQHVYCAPTFSKKNFLFGTFRNASIFEVMFATDKNVTGRGFSLFYRLRNLPRPNIGNYCVIV